jgi:hypothetical protein
MTPLPRALGADEVSRGLCELSREGASGVLDPAFDLVVVIGIVVGTAGVHFLGSAWHDCAVISDLCLDEFVRGVEHVECSRTDV